MRITSIRVTNYKGFSDSGEVELSPGFNLIVGQNNSGKTALLEAFRFSAQPHNPHRRRDKPAGYPLDPASRFEAKVVVTGDELRNTILAAGNPVDVPFSGEWSEPNVQNFAHEFFANERQFCVVGSMDNSAFRSKVYPSHQLFPDDGRKIVVSRFVPSPNRQEIAYERVNARNDNIVEQIVFQIVTARTFVFKAERLNIGTSPSSDAPQLRPDASNLPTALAWLVGHNFVLYKEYLDAVGTVLPSVKHVASVASGPNFILQIWTTPPAEKRPDLAVTLADSGTGVGQVLAILFVALVMPPSVLVIDEPNSFLHPGAAKKLLDILRKLPHQYVISTHSSEVIAAAGDSSTIHLVRWDGSMSSVARIGAPQSESARWILLELGSSLSDVFSADSVLWVEGVTEELCFPLLLEYLGIQRPGLVVRGVKNTGDFEGRKARMAWEVYTRLSGSYALVPPALAFSFDRETRKPREMEDLTRESNGKVRFLTRRTFENFLLVPPAIAEVLNAVGVQVKASDVARKLQDARGTVELETWLAEADAPKLLKDLFWELSGHTLEYKKSEHSVAITKSLLASKPDVLAPLFEYLRELLG